VKAGRYGATEHEAHRQASEHMGAHRGIYTAVRAADAMLAASPPPPAAIALSDEEIDLAWWSLGTEPDGGNLAAGTTLTGWHRAIRWAEKQHGIAASAPKEPAEPVPAQPTEAVQRLAAEQFPLPPAKAQAYADTNGLPPDGVKTCESCPTCGAPVTVFQPKVGEPIYTHKPADGVAASDHQTVSDQSPIPAPPQPQAPQADQKLLEQAGEALESCSEGGYRDIDGDWCEHLWFDKEKVAAALAALRGQADDAKDAQRYRWLTKYAYIGECFTDQVPSGVILEVTRTDRRVPDACGIAASVDTAIDAAIAAEQKGQSNGS
jgi:hypothetical protein